MDNKKHYDRKIVLEDGQEYYGYGFGFEEDRVLELVFNTSMAGYQEILSDPSYTCQAVVMTYPLIGNYGMAADDYETDRPSIGALIVREYNDRPSNFRSVESLGRVMELFHIPGIWGVDTRKLTRSIWDYGSRKALICDASLSREEALRNLAERDVPKDVVSLVSCREKKVVEAGQERHRIVVIDCGIKENILRSFKKRGVTSIVVPWNTSAQEIRTLQPEGIFISNGPGDPADVPETIQTVKKLIGSYPIFGICLGHQIISLAYGARIYKLKFGHRGGNHPVKDLTSGRIEITSQNHSYAVDEDSLKDTSLELTHVNLLDHTVEGVCCLADRVMSVQYHPESAPGPQDSGGLFDQFVGMLRVL
ncbi:MAG: glutamine-hydrolyzing carbamoyl-phosphate synthase small subunit [Eubacterium sp.]|nr:glutamine-hydrolyzing carbamoyl-phosphate synthase small subunit [Eubacterium sp.]